MQHSLFYILVFCYPFLSALGVDWGTRRDPISGEWPMHTIYLGDKLCNGLDGRDINGDGLTDYVTNYEDNGNIVIMFHPGLDKAKEPWPSILIGNFPTAESCCFGDVDGDGNADVIVAHGDQRVSDVSGLAVIWNPGIERVDKVEAWESSQGIAGSVEIGNYLYVRVADIDLDDAMDIIAGGRAEGKTAAPVTEETPIVGMIWCKAPEDPAERRDVSKWVTYEIDSDIISGHGFDYGDMDNDGDIDIVLANHDWGLDKHPSDQRKAVQWYENPGKSYENEWERHVLVDNEDDFYTKPFAAVGDLNGDQLNDFVTLVNDRILYFENKAEAPGVFDRLDIAKPDYADWRARPLKIEDVNLDGQADIVVGSIHHDGLLPSEVAAVYWMEFSGETPADADWITHVVKWGDGWHGGRRHKFTGEKWDIITFADVDMDGDLDIVANCEEYNPINVVWFENPQR